MTDLVNALITDCKATLLKYHDEFNPEFIRWDVENCYCKENLDYVIKGCQEEGFTFANNYSKIIRKNNKMKNKCNHIWEEECINKITTSS